jgi:hypothetical protein
MPRELEQHAPGVGLRRSSQNICRAFPYAAVALRSVRLGVLCRFTNHVAQFKRQWPNRQERFGKAPLYSNRQAGIWISECRAQLSFRLV